MENTESNNSNAKLTSFSPEEATPTNTTIDNNNLLKDKESNNILNKDMVTRPILWGLVVFLVFFALVIGSVSVYRIYQNRMIPESTVSTTPINNSEPASSPINKLETTPVTTNTTQEANIIESEVKSIDADLEGDAYSDSSLGL